MEISLMKKDGKIHTRFKVRIKENWLLYLTAKYGINTEKPVKENSRYLYYEKEGDWINKSSNTMSQEREV